MPRPYHRQPPRAQTDYRILNAADFLIMDALCRKPMTTKELSHLTTISRASIIKVVKRFKDLGLIVQRATDKKWIPVIVMRVETPRETVEIGLGTPVHPQVEEQVGRVQPKAPTAILPPLPPKQYEPPKPEVPVSPKAERISNQMRIPAYLIEYGEVNIGKMGECCKCSTATPVVYGSYNVCPLCARR